MHALRAPPPNPAARPWRLCRLRLLQGRSRGWALVEYSTQAEADNAVATFAGQAVGDRPINVRLDKAAAGNGASCRACFHSLFVRSITDRVLLTRKKIKGLPCCEALLYWALASLAAPPASLAGALPPNGAGAVSVEQPINPNR